MTMRAIICGSVAFDTIMNFDGHFQEHILPDRVHMLNVAFLVPRLRREYGGLAGKIPHNKRLLWGLGGAMATVGAGAGGDFGWMRVHGVPAPSIQVIRGED